MNHHTHMMQHLTHHLKKALDKKTYNKETIGLLACQTIADHFDKKWQITGYVRNNVFVLSVEDQACKMQVFLEQRDIVTKINTKLEHHGYDTIITKIMRKQHKNYSATE